MTEVSSLGGIIDQRGMSGEERLALAGVLRDAWWDCHLAFLGRLVDLHHLGLTAQSLTALAADLDECGYPIHAGAVRAVAAPTRPAASTPVAPRAVRRRTHGRRGARVTG